MMTARLLVGLFGVATTGLVAAAVAPSAMTGTGGGPTEISVTLSDSRGGASGVTYGWNWTNAEGATIRCVSLEFDASADGSGGMPGGMDLTSSALSAYGGTWALDATKAGSGVVTFSTPDGVLRAPGSSTLHLSGVTNPAGAGSHFLSVTTTDTPASGGICGGAAVDSPRTAAFATTSGQLTTLAVDPSLSLIVNGAPGGTECNGVTSDRPTTSNTVEFGRLSAGAELTTGVQTLTVVTNAGGGYSVHVHSTGPLRGEADSNRTFADVAGTHAAPVQWPGTGTEAFGYTVGDVTEPALTQFSPSGFAALSGSAALVMHNSATPPASGDTDCVAYQMSKAGDTPADSYSTTVLYGVSARF